MVVSRGWIPLSDGVRLAVTLYSPADAEAGMAEMSQRFRDMGGQVYVDAEKVKAANKALG